MENTVQKEIAMNEQFQESWSTMTQDEVAQLKEIESKINYWRGKERVATKYLLERLRDKAELLHKIQNITN